MRARVAGILRTWQDQMQVDVLPQKRLRIAPERFRVPDICVVRREVSVEEMTERARDYLDMGWIWASRMYGFWTRSRNKPMNSAPPA